MSQSSFAKQINNLKNQQSRFENEKTQASLLFSFKEAAGFSIDSIHQMAQQGFNQLEKLSPIFTQFKVLLNDENKKIDRQMLIKKDNQQLSTQLKQLLLLLASEFQNENCHKVLEYLIKNFQVHVHESDELVIYFMGYHSHPLFAKLVQNVNLGQHKHFQFMELSAKQGLSFPRNLFCKQIFYDIWLLEQIIFSVNEYQNLINKNVQNKILLLLQFMIQQIIKNYQIINYKKQCHMPLK